METNLRRDANFMLTGHGGFYNRGCEAIVRSTVDLLRLKWPTASITLYSSDFENDLSQFTDEGFRVRPYPHTRFTADWFLYGMSKRMPKLGQLFARSFGPIYYKADACLSVGGDNYTLDYGFRKGLLLRDRITMQSGIPLIIWGASIGPFESTSQAKSKMKEHLKSVDLITARDSITVEYLTLLGITRNVVGVFDPAFTLKPEPYFAPENQFIESGDMVGLNVSSLITRWRTDKNLEVLINEIAEFVEAAVAKNLKVLLVPHVTRKTWGLENDDEGMLAMVIKRKRFRNESVSLLPGYLTARQVKWVISKCRFFIGARTHSTIAAISSGVPTVTIAYSQKASGINRDVFGHEDYVLSTPLVSRDTLMNKLDLLMKNESAIRNFLKDKESEMIHSAQKNVVALMEMLDQKSSKKNQKRRPKLQPIS